MAERKKGKEKPVNPEEVWGSKFRIPTVIGQGSGQGFEFDGLHLPRGWEAAIPELKTISRKTFKEFFRVYCQEMGYSAGKVNFDPSTGVLVKLTVKTDPVSELSLVESFVEKEKGIYRAHHLRDAGAAIVLQKTISVFLNQVARGADMAQPYPFIEGSREAGYFPVDLKIPEEFLEVEKPLTDDHFQEILRMRASNIAGRFGQTLKWIQFDERGIPIEFQLSERNRCYYGINRLGEYYAHNVDTASQALALQGMTAPFINQLLSMNTGVIETKSPSLC